MNSIEIFKTNVALKSKAQQLIEELSYRFPDYKVNFDLEDCDRILRVESASGAVKISSIMNWLRDKHIECNILN